jgi:hypothetical protein
VPFAGVVVGRHEAEGLVLYVARRHYEARGAVVRQIGSPPASDTGRYRAAVHDKTVQNDNRQGQGSAEEYRTRRDDDGRDGNRHGMI